MPQPRGQRQILQCDRSGYALHCSHAQTHTHTHTVSPQLDGVHQFPTSATKVNARLLRDSAYRQQLGPRPRTREQHDRAGGCGAAEGKQNGRSAAVKADVSPLDDRRRVPRRSTAMTTTMKPRSTRTTRKYKTNKWLTHTQFWARLELLQKCAAVDTWTRSPAGRSCPDQETN